MPNATTSTPAVTPMTAILFFMVKPSTGAYSRLASRITSGSRSSIRRGKSKLASTGISVIDSTSEPAKAKITVNAIGRNSFPSMPSSVRIGKYTIMMISSPKSVGLRTSTAASRMVLKKVSGTFSGESPGRPIPAELPPEKVPDTFLAMRRTQFSTMTTELSTTIPKSMAPRLSRLAAMPKRNMPENAHSIDNGIAKATMPAARRLPRNAKSTAITSKPPSKRLFRAVSMT